MAGWPKKIAEGLVLLRPHPISALVSHFVTRVDYIDNSLVLQLGEENVERGGEVKGLERAHTCVCRARSDRSVKEVYTFLGVEAPNDLSHG